MGDKLNACSCLKVIHCPQHLSSSYQSYKRREGGGGREGGREGQRKVGRKGGREGGGEGGSGGGEGKGELREAL